MKNKAMRLVIDDSVAFTSTKIPKFVERAIKVLDQLPDGKLIKRPALAERTQVGSAYTKGFTPHPALANYQVLYKGVILFGNPRTIVEARKQLLS